MDEHSRSYPLTRSSSISSLASDKQPQVQLRDIYKQQTASETHQIHFPDSNITAEIQEMLETDPTLQKISLKAKTLLTSALERVDIKHNKLITSLAHQLITKDSTASSINSTLDPIMQRLDELDKQMQDLKSAQSTPSYADALRQRNIPKATLCLLGDGKLPMKQISKFLKSSPAPPDITVTKFKERQNHIEVRAKNEEQKDKLKTALTEKFKEAQIPARVEDKHPATTKIIFHNASIHTDDLIIHNLVDRGFQRSDIKKCFALRSKTEGLEHWVYELPRGKTNEILLTNYNPSVPSYIQIGFTRLYFRIFVRLTRCRNCHMLGDHLAHLCKEKRHCVNCGGTHNEEQCNQPTHCLNCDFFNKTIASRSNHSIPIRDPYHAANDSNCPTYKAGLNNLMRNEPLNFIDTTTSSTSDRSRIPPLQSDALLPRQVPQQQNH